MNFPAIPKIEGTNYLHIDMTFCFGKSPNHLVVKFCTEGGEYFPVIIMDEKSEFPLSCDELTNFANWCKKMCQFLEERANV